MQRNFFLRGSGNSLLTLIVIVGIFLYWMYLAFVTQPILVHDAKGYEDLGIMIQQKGWKAYFISGPNREPIYPFLVSLCMQIAGEGSSYQPFLKFIQILLLFAAILLFAVFLFKCKIATEIRIFAILYLGISPAFVNSGLSIYSEIVTYVSILGIILVSMRSWVCLQKQSASSSFLHGLALGFVFVVITLTKGIYEIIFPLFLFVFFALGAKAVSVKNRRVFCNVAVFLFASATVFGLCIGSYKAVNKKYNGLFVLTDRGAWALYGNTARRQESLTARKFLTGVAYNLFEEDDCAFLFDRKSCHFWDVATSDHLAAQKNYEVIGKFPREEHDRQFRKLIVDKILQNPFQYILLISLDWVHMFFWESTRIGFVVYPDWLDGVFDNLFFAKSLRFFVGAISLFAIIFAGIYLLRHKVCLWQEESPQDNFPTGLLFSVYLIICHVTLYALFATVARFALPIAPVFILVIACVMQILIDRKRKTKQADLLK